MSTESTQIKLKTHKKCSFNDNVYTYETYSPDEYDRHCIDSILYQKVYRKISDREWINILTELRNFKNGEMIVHLSTIRNKLY